MDLASSSALLFHLTLTLLWRLFFFYVPLLCVCVVYWCMCLVWCLCVFVCVCRLRLSLFVSPHIWMAFDWLSALFLRAAQKINEEVGLSKSQLKRLLGK